MPLLTRLYDKARWRLDVLLDRETVAELWGPTASFPLQAALRDAARTLPLGDRLRLLLPESRRPAVDALLHARLRRRDADGEEYFAVDGRRIYFRPRDFAGDGDELLAGTHLILREAFSRPSEFFQEPVELHEGDVALDLGANIGTSAMLFADRVGSAGSVYSFEPVFPELLRHNVEANDLASVHVVPAAVADAPGELVFDVTDIGIDSRIATTTTKGHLRRVPVTTVDDFVAEAHLDRVDFIKMDIEGAEERALLGAARTLRTHRPKLTIASYHTDPEGRQQHPRLVSLLRRMGYQVRESGQQHIYAWCA